MVKQKVISNYPIFIFAVMMFIMLLAYAIYYYSIAYPQNYVPTVSVEVMPSDFTYAIDSSVLSRGVLTVSGWALEKGRNLSGNLGQVAPWSMNIIVQDKATGAFKKLSARFQQRNDVTDALKNIPEFQNANGNSVDYGASGFISSGVLKGEISDYNMYILYQCNNSHRLVRIGV